MSTDTRTAPGDSIEQRRWPRNPRYIACSDGQVIGPSGRPVGSPMPTGHIIVTYRTPDGRKSIGAHAIICETFHGPAPEPRMEVAHEDGDPGNNRPGNLRWTLRPGNSADRVRHGRNGVKLANEDVQAIRAAKGSESCEALAARFGVGQQTIVHIWRGRTWSNLPAA